jgi:BirA family biotin operon repressor/biotin-[acetyl-CoA-carboxylase] ligase
MIIGNHIITLDKTKSTNYYANEKMALKMLPEGTVIRAGYQTAGKGLEGNHWFSSPAKNVLMSIVFHPSYLKPADQFLLNKMSSLGVADTVRELLDDHEVKIKWPNDLLVNGSKIAGILIQSSFMGDAFTYSIVGIGLNVNEDVFPEEIPDPTSLQLVAKREFSTDKVFSLLLEKLNFWFSRLIGGHYKMMHGAYLRNLYRYREKAGFEINGKRVDGMIEGIDSSGRLLIRGISGEEFHCDLKEVKYL